MDSTSFNAVDAYLHNLYVGADEDLESALKESEAAGLPAIQAPNQGKLLMILAMAIGAKSILEIGTLGGYSTIWLARALPQGGRLVTLEYEPLHAEVARKNVDRAGVGHLIDIRVGAAAESSPESRAPSTSLSSMRTRITIPPTLSMPSAFPALAP